MSGDYANLSWNKVSHEDFDGYKVMYSFTDTTPVYGESDCYYAKYITNAINNELHIERNRTEKLSTECQVLFFDHRIV